MKKFMALTTAVVITIAGYAPVEAQVIESEHSNIIEDEYIDISIEENLYKSLTGVVATGQTDSYDKDGSVGEYYYGQDADYYDSMPFSYTNNGDGTITDNSTNLMWQEIPIDTKMSWAEAMEYCENLELGGYDDWRLPTAKELFSLSDFSVGWPFIDTDYFGMPDENAYSNVNMSGGQGGTAQGGGPQTGNMQEGQMLPPLGEGMQEGQTPPPSSGSTNDDSISKDEGQFWSSDYYLVDTEESRNGVAFGVNHATGHIKAYQANGSGMFGKNVRAVRGDEYAVNQFIDNGDQTITDTATNLMWTSVDLGVAVDWETALEMAENSEFAGYTDWRLPDVKELQILLDYSGNYPAIDPEFFSCTELEDNENYYYWTSTSAYFSPADPTNYYAWYVAFGYAVDDSGADYHGAGGVRFSPKYLDSEAAGEGGDNMLNSVRLVRTVD